MLAQFTSGAAARTDRSLFAFLALDDATHAVTAESVRAVQRLRNCNAGVLLTLRGLGDVPESLHAALLGSVGCHMTFSGVTTWDGRLFAQAWGTEWVETTEVAKHTVFADQPLTRAVHALRKLVTGKAVTTDAVTVRRGARALVGLRTGPPGAGRARGALPDHRQGRARTAAPGGPERLRDTGRGPRACKRLRQTLPPWQNRGEPFVRDGENRY